MLNVYEQVDRNKRRSTIVMVLFVVFITLVAFAYINFLCRIYLASGPRAGVHELGSTRSGYRFSGPRELSGV